MFNKKLLMILVVTVVIATLVASSFVPPSSAESEDNLKVRTFRLYQFETELEYDPSNIIDSHATGYDSNSVVYFFESESPKELQFMNYVSTGEGSLPSLDDRADLKEGDHATGYCIVFSQSIGHVSETGGVNVRLPDDTYYYGTQKIYDNTIKSYHFEEGIKLSLNVNYDSSICNVIYSVTLFDSGGSTSIRLYNIYDGVTQNFTAPYDADYYLQIISQSSNLDDMWTTVSYDMNIGDSVGFTGSGGLIVAAVFFVIAVLFLALIFKLYGGPKWSR